MRKLRKLNKSIKFGFHLFHGNCHSLVTFASSRWTSKQEDYVYDPIKQSRISSSPWNIFLYARVADAYIVIMMSVCNLNLGTTPRLN